MAADSRALLESKQLLGTEGLVVDLGSGLDEILEVGAEEEVTEVDELAVVLVLDCEMLAVHGSVESIQNIPLMTPHLVWRPRTFWPLTTTVFSEPTTAKGMSSCDASAKSSMLVFL